MEQFIHITKLMMQYFSLAKGCWRKISHELTIRCSVLHKLRGAGAKDCINLRSEAQAKGCIVPHNLKQGFRT